MLSKQSKLDLRNNKDFFINCKKKHFQYFSFFYIKNNQGLKVSVIVPKKIVKLAVDRNKVKRMFYLAIEELFSEIENKIDLVIIVNKNVVNKKALNLKKIIKGSLIEITV